MLEGYISDKLHDEDGFAYSRSSEKTDFSAPRVRSHEVYNLDSRFKYLVRCLNLGERRGRVMYRPVVGGFYLSRAVYRVAEHIYHASERSLAYRNGYRSAGIYCSHSAGHTVSRNH